MTNKETNPNWVKDYTSWGLEARGLELFINQDNMLWLTDTPWIVDVETDEEDHLVGVGIHQADSKHAAYFTTITPFLHNILMNHKLIGHNILADIEFLWKNGVEVPTTNIVWDTCIASYVMCATKKSHGLKPLVKELFGIEYPSYKEIVGTGAKRQTLNKQEVNLVANYNGMDCYATGRLYKYQKVNMTPNQQRILQTIELPITRLLCEMKKKGILLDAENLNLLKGEFDGQIKGLENQISTYI